MGKVRKRGLKSGRFARNVIVRWEVRKQLANMKQPLALTAKASAAVVAERFGQVGKITKTNRGGSRACRLVVHSSGADPAVMEAFLATLDKDVDNEEDGAVSISCGSGSARAALTRKANCVGLSVSIPKPVALVGPSQKSDKPKGRPPGSTNKKSAHEAHCIPALSSARLVKDIVDSQECNENKSVEAAISGGVHVETLIKPTSKHKFALDAMQLLQEISEE